MANLKPSMHPKLAKAQQLVQTGKLPEALALLDKICRKDKRNADANFLKGMIHGKTGDLEGAAKNLRRATLINPRHALAYFNMGNVLVDLGKINEAVHAYDRALQLEPTRADIIYALAKTNTRLGNFKQGINHFRHYQTLQPSNPDGYGNLAACFFMAGELEEAAKNYEKALNLQRKAVYYDGLGAVLCQQGKYDEAIQADRKAATLQPENARFHSNLLLTLNYLPSLSQEEFLNEHKRWDALHSINVLSQKYSNPVDPDRRLRIGYLSPDFRTHSVAYFFEPLLQNHDNNAVETYCYACTPHCDETTKRLQSESNHWSNITAMDDRQAIAKIKSDGIDILVDLSGHTAKNRLVVMSGKPAPIQMNWLGYPATTGLASIDYKVTDGIADPAGSEIFYTEQLIRLPGCFLCYTSPLDTPSVAPSPAEENGFITFGSFNNMAKINELVIKLWSELLNKLPDSRILIKNPSLTDKATAERYVSIFRHYGVNESRVELLGLAPSTYEHLQTYNRIDIALDTFPYNGTTTSCEALYMGVPVITYAGETHAGRVGSSILTALDLGEYIASSQDDYIAIAARLAGNKARLTELRNDLRLRMAKSPLTDGRAFARKMEQTYRTIWQAYCSPGRNI